MTVVTRSLLWVYGCGLGAQLFRDGYQDLSARVAPHKLGGYPRCGGREEANVHDVRDAHGGD